MVPGESENEMNLPTENFFRFSVHQSEWSVLRAKARHLKSGCQLFRIYGRFRERMDQVMRSIGGHFVLVSTVVLIVFGGIHVYGQNSAPLRMLQTIPIAGV